ncbi:MAG: hypothetical protein QM644_18475 [Mobilitalea sp.]
MKNNYKNDVFTGNRKYQMVDNGDGTFSFVDVTVYSQVGDTFAALDINNITTEFNNHNHNGLYYGKSEVEYLIGESVYTHPTTSGYKHLPSGGTTGQFLKNTDNGTGGWSNLGTVITATLLASGWTTTAPYQQTLTVSGATASNTIFFDYNDSITQAQYESAAWGMLKVTSQGVNSVVIKSFGEKPLIDIPVKFLITA